MSVYRPDNLFKAVSSGVWIRLARAKTQRAQRFWLNEVERQIQEEIKRLGTGCFAKLNHRASKPKVSVCRLYRDSSGFVSLSLKRQPKEIPVSLQENGELSPALPLTSPSALGLPSADGDAPIPPLGLGSVANSHKLSNSPKKIATPIRAKVPRGTKGLTAHGKRLIVGSCNLLEQLYGKDRLSFHSATLPRASKVELAEVARRNQEFFKRWRFYLSRLLKSKGLDGDRIVIVLEFQQRGAVHFHSVFQSSHVRWGDAITREELDRIWQLCVCSLFPFFKGRNFKPACKTEPIRKSVGRYMSKYLSKDFGKQLPKFLKRTSITWYSIGRTLTRLFKEKKECKEVLIENLNFRRLKEHVESLEKIRKPKLVSVRGYGDRVLYGYCDNLEEVEDLISSLFRVRTSILPIADGIEKKRREEKSSFADGIEKKGREGEKSKKEGEKLKKEGEKSSLSLTVNQLELNLFARKT